MKIMRLFIILVCALTTFAQADYVEIVKNAHIYANPDRKSKKIQSIEIENSTDLYFLLALSEQTKGYYLIRNPATNMKGWIYKSNIRLHKGDLPGDNQVIPDAAIRPLRDNEMRAHIINVGQGSATLLEFSCGSVLIDTGGEKNADFDSNIKLSDYVNSFYSNRRDLENTLDLFILSHPHIDHTRGAKWIQENENIQVLNYVDNGQDVGSGGKQQVNWQKYSKASGSINYEAVTLDMIGNDGFTDGVVDPINCESGVDPVIKVLWGKLDNDPGWGNERGTARFENPNNHSVAVKVEFGDVSLLLIGDMEHSAIQSMVEKYHGTNLLDVDIYFVGHHGSKNGTSDELMQAMTPRIAVISSGDPSRETVWTAWKYGHPNKIAIDMLRDPEFGVSDTRTPIEVPIGTRAESFQLETIDSAIYNTGWDGNIILQINSNGRIVPIKQH